MMDRRSFLRLGSAAALGVLVGPELLATPGPRLTLADWARRLEAIPTPSGATFFVSRDVVRLLAQTNELLDDMRWLEPGQVVRAVDYGR